MWMPACSVGNSATACRARAWPSSYDSDIWQSSLEAGYRFNIGQIGSTALSLQPEPQLVYTDATADHHDESNGTIVRRVGDDGLSGRVGLRLQGESRARWARR